MAQSKFYKNIFIIFIHLTNSTYITDTSPKLNIWQAVYKISCYINPIVELHDCITFFFLLSRHEKNLQFKKNFFFINLSLKSEFWFN